MRLQSLLLAGLVLLAGPTWLNRAGQALAAQDEPGASATLSTNVLAASSTPNIAVSSPPGALPGKVFRDCPDCPEMVVVPAGSFLMGRDFSFYAREKPVRWVVISRSFALGKSVVTQGQWRAIMGINPRKFNNCGDNCPCGDACPVGSASWVDVQAFICLLNKKTGKLYRLPSEAEWEYAFDLHDMRGLLDISQPVFEWVDRYDDGSAKVDGRGGDRTIRGGVWLNSPELLHEALRGGPDSALRQNRLGLRLVRELP